MKVTNDAPPSDPIEYILKQLPKDLVKLLEVRDELAKRQGALSAVEAAVAKKVEADAYYENTKESCDKMTAEAKAEVDKAKVQKKACDEREKVLAAREKAYEQALENDTKRLNARETALLADHTALNDKVAALDITAKQLAVAEAEHITRVQAFRDKVAQITA